MLIHWIILIFGGLCEAGWAYCLNRSHTDSAYWLIGFAALYILSAVCLAAASRKIPVGTAYAVWTGIGACGTVIMGFILFDEPVTVIRIVCIAMIFMAVIGLQITN